MTEQKIVVVDGRKFEAVPQPSGECGGCRAMGDYRLCQALPECGSAFNGGVDAIYVEVEGEPPAPMPTAAFLPKVLVINFGNGEQSKRVEELLAHGYRLLDYHFLRQEALLVLGDDVVHPQFSVKG